jgi:putative membrane protein
MRVLRSAVTASVVAAASPALAQGFPYGGHMWGGGWSMFFGPLWTTLLLALAVVLIVGVARRYGREERAQPGRSALRILEERFARGEINKQEFEERRATLSQ